MALELTAVFQQVPEGFIAFVEELPGANSQGATLAEARSNLHEAVTLVLEANRALSEQALADAGYHRVDADRPQTRSFSLLLPQP